MMNVASPSTAPIPNQFAPPARTASTRRQLYHHPTLHVRVASGSSARNSPQQQPPLSPHYSHPSTSQNFSSSNRSLNLHPTYSQRNSLQRQPTAASGNSSTQTIHPGPHTLGGHHRQGSSISTSNSSITRVPSWQGQSPSSTPPMLQVRPNSISLADTYVARLRRARATVWSARGQNEELGRSNSREDKYNKKYGKRGAPPRNKLSSGGSSMYNYEVGLHAHPRQLAPRLSANEAEGSDYMDPFTSGPNYFDTTNHTAPSTKGSIKTKTTTSSDSPSASSKNVPQLLTQSDTAPRGDEGKSSRPNKDGRGSPDPMQNYYNPPARGHSKRMPRKYDDDDDVKDQVGGGRRLFVVNASSSENEDEE